MIVTDARLADIEIFNHLVLDQGSQDGLYRLTTELFVAADVQLLEASQR